MIDNGWIGLSDGKACDFGLFTKAECCWLTCWWRAEPASFLSREDFSKDAAALLCLFLEMLCLLRPLLFYCTTSKCKITFAKMVNVFKLKVI